MIYKRLGTHPSQIAINIYVYLCSLYHVKHLAFGLFSESSSSHVARYSHYPSAHLLLCRSQEEAGLENVCVQCQWSGLGEVFTNMLLADLKLLILWRVGGYGKRNWKRWLGCLGLHMLMLLSPSQLFGRENWLFVTGIEIFPRSQITKHYFRVIVKRSLPLKHTVWLVSGKVFVATSAGKWLQAFFLLLRNSWPDHLLDSGAAQGLTVVRPCLQLSKTLLEAIAFHVQWRK